MEARDITLFGQGFLSMMQIKVFMVPKNHEYINRLKFSLWKEDVIVEVLKPFHYSTLINIFKLLFYRLKGYRIIHVHWLYIFPFGFVMKWFYYFCKSLGIKVVWEMHNILPHNYSETDKKNSRWFYEKSDAMIFHSKDDISRSREVLGTNANKPYVVIPHGNFNESYENKISKNRARQILGISDDKKVILCFGFLRKNRGYEYLIEATKEMQNTVVVVAGKILEVDVYKKLIEYEKKISNLRVFTKWIPDNEIQIYFKASDIVVLPYTEITTSGVIPLAYAFSKPVVTTDIGGIRDVVNDNTGILVPTQDAIALKKAIDRIFTMDFEAMGRYAHEYAEREFSWGSNAQKIKRLYESINA